MWNTLSILSCLLLISYMTLSIPLNQRLSLLSPNMVIMMPSLYGLLFNRINGGWVSSADSTKLVKTTWIIDTSMMRIREENTVDCYWYFTVLVVMLYIRSNVFYHFLAEVQWTATTVLEIKGILCYSRNGVPNPLSHKLCFHFLDLLK